MSRDLDGEQEEKKGEAYEEKGGGVGGERGNWNSLRGSSVKTGTVQKRLVSTNPEVDTILGGGRGRGGRSTSPAGAEPDVFVMVHWKKETEAWRISRASRGTESMGDYVDIALV